VGGDQVEYDGDVSTKTANIITAKLLFNSIVSTPKQQTLYDWQLKTDFYLGTPMQAQDYAYMQTPIAILPPNIMDHH